MVAVSGGTAYVDRLIGMGGNWAGRPLVASSAGTLVADATARVA